VAASRSIGKNDACDFSLLGFSFILLLVADSKDILHSHIQFSVTGGFVMHGCSSGVVNILTRVLIFSCSHLHLSLLSFFGWVDLFLCIYPFLFGLSLGLFGQVWLLHDDQQLACLLTSLSWGN